MSRKINRREFIKTAGSGLLTLGALLSTSRCRASQERPNIIFILADDLGYGELGCYRQSKIKTPHLDRMAQEGMKFTQHYSGSAVCAPARCTLLTGLHTGHAYIRDNDEMRERGDVWHDPNLEGQRPIPEDTITIATLLQRAGYHTAAIGKWGLGGPDSPGHPNKHGFDLFFGYLCQRVAHNYYPTHLWKNNQKYILEGNEYFFPHQKFPPDKDPYDPQAYQAYRGKIYSVDVMMEEALHFIEENKSHPFFLYLALPLPHVALQVPDDSLQEYQGQFPETPYLGEKGYLPHPTPRAAYAAMISRLDREVGRVMNLLKKLGLEEKTLVIFTSDNGPTYAGGVDYEFFNSAGPLRGLKGSLYEGGIRVPLLVKWPGQVKPGTVSDHVSAFWDFLPTFMEIIGRPTPVETDGISMLPTWLGHPEKQITHEYLYWELHGQQAVRWGDWKGIRRSPEKEIELYNLRTDISEAHNLANQHPEIVAKIQEIMSTARTESELFPLIRKKAKPSSKNS